MTDKQVLYRIQFVSNGERYELYVRELSQGGLFGFVEIGSVTPRPQDGNAKPRMFRSVTHSRT